MAEERVDRARKMVGCIARVSRFASHRRTPNAAEIISQSTHCTASPSFSSTLTGHIFPLCAFSTNASNKQHHMVVNIAHINQQPPSL